jgi:hypothetical protein
MVSSVMARTTMSKREPTRAWRKSCSNARRSAARVCAAAALAALRSSLATRAASARASALRCRSASMSCTSYAYCRRISRTPREYPLRSRSSLAHASRGSAAGSQLPRYPLGLENSCRSARARACAEAWRPRRRGRRRRCGREEESAMAAAARSVVAEVAGVEQRRESACRRCALFTWSSSAHVNFSSKISAHHEASVRPRPARARRRYSPSLPGGGGKSCCVPYQFFFFEKRFP